MKPEVRLCAFHFSNDSEDRAVHHGSHAFFSLPLFPPPPPLEAKLYTFLSDLKNKTTPQKTGSCTLAAQTKEGNMRGSVPERGGRPRNGSPPKVLTLAASSVVFFSIVDTPGRGAVVSATPDELNRIVAEMSVRNAKTDRMQQPLGVCVGS